MFAKFLRFFAKPQIMLQIFSQQTTARICIYIALLPEDEASVDGLKQLHSKGLTM